MFSANKFNILVLTSGLLLSSVIISEEMSFKNKMEFDKTLKENPLVAVKFFAEWCGPCKMMKPIFKKFSEDEKYKNIKFIEVDVDKNKELIQALKISSMPTFRFYKNGMQSSEFMGGVPEKVRAELDKLAADMPMAGEKKMAMAKPMRKPSAKSTVKPSCGRRARDMQKPMEKTMPMEKSMMEAPMPMEKPMVMNEPSTPKKVKKPRTKLAREEVPTPIN